MRFDERRVCRALIAPAVVAAAALLNASLWVALPRAEAGPARAGEEVVWAGDDEFVKLVPAEPGSMPNEHPARFAADELAAALACVMLRRDGTNVPLLARKDAARLAPHLARAFARAAPTQDVVLAAHVRIQGAILARQEVSLAARLFVVDDRMQVIVGDLFRSVVAPEFYHSPVAGRQIDRRLHPHEPGSRTRETTHQDATFEPAPGIGLRDSSGGPRADWLALEVDALSKRCTHGAPAGAVLPAQ